MTAETAPATSGLMAFARSIGGAVRGLGRRVLAKVRRVRVSRPVAAPLAPEVVEMLQQVQALMAEFRLTGRVGGPDELSPADIDGLQPGSAMAEALAEYRSLDQDALLNDPEYLAFLARFMAAFGMHIRLNRWSAGTGMAALCRSIGDVPQKFFQSRIYVFGRSASKSFRLVNDGGISSFVIARSAWGRGLAMTMRAGQHRGRLALLKNPAIAVCDKPPARRSGPGHRPPHVAGC